MNTIKIYDKKGNPLYVYHINDYDNNFVLVATHLIEKEQLDRVIKTWYNDDLDRTYHSDRINDSRISLGDWLCHNLSMFYLEPVVEVFGRPNNWHELWTEKLRKHGWIER